MKRASCGISAVLMAVVAAFCWAATKPKERLPSLSYRVVDTGQRQVFSDRGQLLKAPRPDEPFYGQDAQFQVNPPSYTVSGDGLTVYDNVTGLTWQRSPDTNGDGRLTPGDKLTWDEARRRPAALNAAAFGGVRDWRLPTIKELYSLITFAGTDPSGYAGTDTSGLTPFIGAAFKFAYGQPDSGERIIDSQYASGTLSVSKGWRGFGKLFGVNFADGRIKGYDVTMPDGSEKTFYVQCVRGGSGYGVNDFRDNGDRTITDRATGLMWSRDDSGQGMNWQEALAWVRSRNREDWLGHHDWRLPSAKELQTIVDYARSPDTTRSPAIDPRFTCTRIVNEAGQPDYPCYWTATTHGTSVGRAAVYVAFGRAMGYLRGQWHDVHGAGAQRSDPKSGDKAAFPYGHGPQGDAIRIANYVRAVRNVDPASGRPVEPDLSPLPLWQPPRGAERGPRAEGPPPGGAGGFHLLPRFAMERLDLSRDQLQQIAGLERETKAKLDEILTPRQRRMVDEFQPPPAPFSRPPQ